MPTELWNAVQKRLQSRTGARPNGTGKKIYLFSGLLKCAVCGGSMSIIGARTKNGQRYPQFGCSAHNNKGDVVCSNSMTISEKKVNEMLLGALRDTLMEPGLVGRFIDRFNAKVLEAQRALAQADDVAKQLESLIAEQRDRARKLTDAVVAAGWSKALGERLREEETRLTSLQEQRSAHVAAQGRAQVLPHPSVVERYLHDLLGTLEAAPERGRELWRSISRRP